MCLRMNIVQLTPFGVLQGRSRLSVSPVNSGQQPAELTVSGDHHLIKSSIKKPSQDTAHHDRQGCLEALICGYCPNGVSSLL
jgi:hypothetical protein